MDKACDMETQIGFSRERFKSLIHCTPQQQLSIRFLPCIQVYDVVPTLCSHGSGLYM